MIAFLQGKLEKKTQDHVLIDVNGIGYQVCIPLSSYEKLPRVGEEVKLYTWMSTGLYGGNTLYAFLTTEEKEIFLLLNSISKIGSKEALKILSKISLSLSDFKRAIIEKDLQILTTIFGLTKKTSERLILGLRDKIKTLEIKSKDLSAFKDKQCISDAISALVALGYKTNEAKEATNIALENLGKEMSVEEIVKHALKYL